MNDHTFALAEEYVSALNYTGPLALICDDMKLFAALRMYYDGTSEQWFVVGGVGEPLVVADVDQLRDIITQEKVEKATKVQWFVHSGQHDG